MEKIKHAAEVAADTMLGKVVHLLESHYPNAYPASFFKNLERCRELNGYLEQQDATRAALPAEIPTAAKVPQKQLPLWVEKG